MLVTREPYVGTVTSEPTVCDVVIPCRDEAPALPDLLARMPAGFRAIVVDNGSRDATAEVARSLGATVVSEPRPGYGAAVHAGLEAATADFVAVLDGDGSMDPAELVCLFEEVAGGRADLAVGRRRPSARGVWPWHARAGNALVLWWLRRRIGMPLHDIAPMRVARRRETAGARGRGPPVRLPRRAAPTRDRRRLALRREGHRLPPARGRHEVQGLRIAAGYRSGQHATSPGCSREAGRRARRRQGPGGRSREDAPWPGGGDGTRCRTGLRCAAGHPHNLRRGVRR